MTQQLTTICIQIRMETWTKMIFKIAALLTLVYVSNGSTFGPKMATFVKQNRAFAGELYKFVTSQAKEPNVIFSPFSISQALGMVLAGAEGQTKFQIKRLLRIAEMEDYRIHNLMRKSYGNCVTKSTGQLYKVANHMYVQDKYEVKDSFNEIMQVQYQAPAQKINFTESEHAADKINQWVSNNTEGYITDLINPDSINALTRMILVNAIYFEGAWVKKFEKLSQTCPFYLAGGKMVQVNCMRFEGRVKVHSMPKMRMVFVAFPYNSLRTDGRTSYLVIGAQQPQEQQQQAQPDFSTHASFILKHKMKINEWTERTSNITMPTFTIKGGVNMKPIMQEMRVGHLFDPLMSNLTGISDEHLYVKEFVHKAYIDVNENGTVAAAASAVSLFSRSGAGPYILNVDKPFFFGIYNAVSELFTFLGRVGDPTQ